MLSLMKVTQDQESIIVESLPLDNEAQADPAPAGSTDEVEQATEDTIVVDTEQPPQPRRSTRVRKAPTQYGMEDVRANLAMNYDEPRFYSGLG